MGRSARPGQGALGLPPGMTVAGSDGLGLGGLGTSAINGGFTDGLGGGPPGGPLIRRRLRRTRRRWWWSRRRRRRRWWSAAEVAADAEDNPGQNRRGPYNGQFSSFGNRRRNAQPAYTGSVFITLANSALNAAPFSLNGAERRETVLRQRALRSQRRRADGDSQAAQLEARGVLFHLSGNRQPQCLQPGLLGADAGRTRRRFLRSPRPTRPVTIFDPTTGTPFPGNVIPATRINPAALGLLQYIPLPDLPRRSRKITASSPPLPATTTMSACVSTPRSTTRTGSISTSSIRTAIRPAEQLFGFRDPASGYGVSASAGWSHSFAPRFNNSATLTFSRNDNTDRSVFRLHRQRGRDAGHHRHVAGAHQLRAAESFVHQFRQPLGFLGFRDP